jgi:hypothetical protein
LHARAALGGRTATPRSVGADPPPIRRRQCEPRRAPMPAAFERREPARCSTSLATPAPAPADDTPTSCRTTTAPTLDRSHRHPSKRPLDTPTPAPVISIPIPKWDVSLGFDELNRWGLRRVAGQARLLSLTPCPEVHSRVLWPQTAARTASTAIMIVPAQWGHSLSRASRAARPAAR